MKYKKAVFIKQAYDCIRLDTGEVVGTEEDRVKIRYTEVL